MQREKRDFFQHTEANVVEGQRYAFRIGGGPERPDPCSLWQPDGVHAASAVFRPERFTWSDRDWKGMRREELVFYELHIGTFTPEGTFGAVIPRLRELRELGVTAVEIMPVGQFPGDRNWGYDGVLPYAAQNSYGGPHGLQQLVDAWAATFGEVVDTMEISPDGAGLRPRSRFARFTNLPELQQMFRRFSDVQTAEMLNLPRPRLKGGKPIVVACPMSEEQHQLQQELVERTSGCGRRRWTRVSIMPSPPPRMAVS